MSNSHLNGHSVIITDKIMRCTKIKSDIKKIIIKLIEREEFSEASKLSSMVSSYLFAFNNVIELTQTISSKSDNSVLKAMLSTSERTEESIRKELIEKIKEYSGYI